MCRRLRRSRMVLFPNHTSAEEMIGLIDDTPIKPDFSKCGDEFVDDLLRQVHEPFETAQAEYKARQKQR